MKINVDKEKNLIIFMFGEDLGDKCLTRTEILKKVPFLCPGSFDHYRMLAGVVSVGKRPNQKSPHMMEYLYPEDAVDKIKQTMKKGGKL